MPFKRRFKRRPMKGKRKGFRRKRRSVSMQKQLTAFPTNRIVKMRYCTPFQLDSTSGYVEQAFRANGLFDPDFSGTGHQPLGHDQWSVFYNRYTVLGSKITIRAISPSSDNPSVYGVYLHETSSPGATAYTTLVEQGKSQWRYIQNAINGNVPSKCSMTFSAKKWFNIADVKDNSATYGALFGSDPTIQAYYICWTSAWDDTADVPPLNFVAIIDYIVLLGEPREIPAS